MLSNGYIHPRNTHTRPAGIWRKLQSLYDLEALDEREDARQLSDLSVNSEEDEEDDDDEDVYSQAANKIHKEDFDLPDDDFAELKWRQRFLSEEEMKDESPPLLPDINIAQEPPVRFTPSFSVEPRSSEVPTPSTRGGRQKAGAGRGRGRGGTMAAPAVTDKRRSARQAAESVAGSEHGEEEAEGDEEAEESEGAESRDSTPARTTRTGRGRGRGAAAARGRGRVRGRGK